MQNSEQINCPVDLVLVNQNKIRLIALLVFFATLTFYFTQQAVIVLVLVADFFLRAFGLQKYSPLANIADMLVRLLNIKPVFTDQAPKRFAARMGFALTLALLVFNYFNVTWAVIASVAMLAFFSFLESVLGICVGCHIYAYWHKATGGITK